jgi:hypothetical protein
MVAKLEVRRILLAVIACVVAALAWLAPLDRLAQEYVESGLKRALITFAAARTANAIISAVQETTVAIQPLGVGVTLSPAQVLDPLNDLVEQFSTLMMAASISFAIQRVLISIGGYPWVSAALTVALVAWAWAGWHGRPAPTWLSRTLLVLLLVRFAVPIAALGSEVSFRLTMASDYAQAQSAVQATSDEMKRMAPESQPKGTAGAIERLRDWWDRQKMDIQAYFGQLKDKAENMVRHVIVLMALFIVQTLVLPLFFLWLVQRLMRGALAWGGVARPPSLKAGAA